MEFDPACRRCPRLYHHFKKLRARFPDYHNGPVPAFGDPNATLLIVGLAPGLHGANASGRVFTGDASGDLLFDTLHRFGFSNLPLSRDPADGMVLNDCRITNAVKCVPPLNRPNRTELKRCGDYLRAELEQLQPKTVVALGRVAHDAVFRALDLAPGGHPFGHLAEHRLEAGPVVIDSYHCSRYNTNTRRLTETMFKDVFRQIRTLIPAPQVGGGQV